MNDLNLNIWNILILMGIIQGIVFGVVVLVNKRFASETNNYLAYTAFALSFSNLQYWFMDSNLSEKYSCLEWLRIPCEFLIIPMFYIFVNLYLGKKLKPKIKLLLISPFIFDFILQVIRSVNKLFFNENFINSNIINSYLTIEELLSFMYSTILIIFTLRLVNKFEVKNKKYDIEVVKRKTKWLKQILLIGLMACLLWIGEIYIMESVAKEGESVNTSIYYPIWIIISFIVYWLSYVGLIQSNIQVERERIRKKILPKEKNIFSKEKNYLDGDSQDKIFKAFKEFINENYMNTDLNLDNVADALDISSNYLSQIINYNNISFKDYVNSVRVDNVKRALQDDEFSKYTLTSIGLEHGFNSNTSFYRAFKKYVGITPSKYKKTISR